MNNEKSTLTGMIGKKVIVRTYSAGVWFGTLTEKSGNEVILSGARRLWRWWAAESISLSAVAIHGINQEKSKIVQAVDSVWLDAIEIIPCSDVAIASLEAAKNVSAS
jgi:ferredoxin-fold anticodon binding domain-containing protein